VSESLITANVADVYGAPSSRGDIVTQAVQGARVTVDREESGFAHIATEDRYEGWIAAERLTPAWDDGDFFKTSIATLFAEVYTQADASSEMLSKLVVGTRVAVAHRAEIGDWVPLRLPDGQIGYTHRLGLNMTHDGGLAGPSLLDERARRALDIHDLKRQIFQAVGQQAVQVGKRLIGTPYLWGGCTPFGIDCSGFVQLAYRLSGILLLRDAGIQFTDRRFMPVEPGVAFDEAVFAAGDLVVFRRIAEGPITHVGMALGDGRFLHSSGGIGVHIDPCDHPRYTATYAGAVRLSPDADLAIEAA
jgi:hypothetical protein